MVDFLQQVAGRLDAAVVAGLLALVATALSVDGPRWERKFLHRSREYELRKDLEGRYYKRRPTGPKLYSFVPELALGKSVKKRRDRFRLRAEKLLSSPPERVDEGGVIAREWINSVGAFAEGAAKERLDLRPFLATYHLGIIREGTLAVPMGLAENARRNIGKAEMDRIAWGLALVELAVRYNSAAKQQRSAVFFQAQGDDPPVGPVLRETSNVRGLLFDIVELGKPPMRLPRYGRWRWNLWLRMIDVDLPGGVDANG